MDERTFSQLTMRQQVDTLRNWIFTRVKLHTLEPQQAMYMDEIVLTRAGDDLTRLAYNMGYLNERKL